MSKYVLKKMSMQEFDGFYCKLEEDFCFSERKSYQDERRAFEKPDFMPAYICIDGKTVGYICYWEYEEFLYVEHFAMLKEMRNQGYGNGFLQEFLGDFTKLVLLEVERPTDTISERRIRFYERVGFCVNKFDYYQPSYHRDGECVPMFVCSYNRFLSDEEYTKFTSQIKNTVYL